MSALVTDGGNI